MHRLLASTFAAVLVLCARAMPAQSPSASDLLRGRVTDDSARAIVGATVIITRGPDRLVQQTTTDSSGRYSLRFTPGTGDYLVYVSAVGRKSARRRVQRAGSETELVADFQLAPDATMLAEVKVTAAKPERAKHEVGKFEHEPGSSENYTDGVNGQLSPSSAGDLGAAASTLPGVTMTPNGPSILGSGPQSTLTTLNGMGMAATSIPRAANTSTRVTGATYDATRGGFAGANVDVQLDAGDRFYQNRRAQLTFDPRGLQYTDAVGRATGVPVGGFRGSVGADGEIIRQAMTYNVALDVSRSISSPATLLDADGTTFVRAGVSPDSIARLRQVAAPLGILSTSGVPLDRERDGVTWLGRIDDTRDTLATRALLTYAGYNKSGALGFGPLSAPAAAGEQRDQTLGAQLLIGEYLGAGRFTLDETRFAASRATTHTSPYLALPSASVLVRSPDIDPTSSGASTDVSGISLGGGTLFSDETRWSAEGSNDTYWYRRGSRHRFRTQLWGRADGLDRAGAANRLGSFSYNSIADLEAGQPSSFSRTLSQPDRSGRVWNAAAALSHSFVPHPRFSLIYGARLESDGFLSAPPRDAALDQALGVQSGAAPTRLHVSPRIGFTWTYNRDKENGNGMSGNPMGGFARAPVGTIRAGIGDFRDLLRPDLPTDASAGGTLLLSCVGSAVPTADWTQFASDPSSIPTQCAGGGGVLAERAPSLTLISPRYDVPHSWRSSVDWSTDIERVMLKLGVLGSLDLNQPGTVDANFSGVPLFTLDPVAEGGRTMYVSPAAVDAASGTVSPAESRRSSAYGSVNVRNGDLRGYGGQFTATIQPDVFKWRSRVYGSLTYTLQRTRRQYRGFDGAAFGDPRAVEWAPSANDARHVFLLSGGGWLPKVGTVTFFSRLQSGLPFTPIVQGDVNGDGRWGDRAFVPALGTSGDDSLDAQVRSLLAGGSATARACLKQSLGRMVSRNGCRGPWTQSLNMQLSPHLPERWGRRVTANIYLENVLGGIDQMLHGNDLRGWGAQTQPDPVLLVPRAFDETTRRFRYDVNPRFADTRPGRSLFRTPFRVSLDFSFDLAVPYPVQQLRRALEPVRGADHQWTYRNADSLTSFYLSRTSDIFKALLEQSDSLFLSRSQIERLQRADSLYSARVRAVYAPLGEYLAGHNGRDPGKAEVDSAAATEKAYWKVFWEQPEIADSIVTPTQKELFPMLKAMVSVPKDQREHSRWMFGNPVTFSDKPKRGS